MDGRRYTYPELEETVIDVAEKMDKMMTNLLIRWILKKPYNRSRHKEYRTKQSYPYHEIHYDQLQIR